MLCHPVGERDPGQLILNSPGWASLFQGNDNKNTNLDCDIVTRKDNTKTKNEETPF